MVRIWDSIFSPPESYVEPSQGQSEMVKYCTRTENKGLLILA